MINNEIYFCRDENSNLQKLRQEQWSVSAISIWPSYLSLIQNQFWKENYFSRFLLNFKEKPACYGSKMLKKNSSYMFSLKHLRPRISQATFFKNHLIIQNWLNFCWNQQASWSLLHFLSIFSSHEGGRISKFVEICGIIFLYWVYLGLILYDLLSLIMTKCVFLHKFQRISHFITQWSTQNAYY